MYKPTEIERNNCIRIVKEILKCENDSECEQYANKILNMSYSIGGDYSEKTITSIAEVLLEKNADLFQNKLKKAIELCNVELEKRRKGLPGEGTVEQLEEIILPELYRLQKDVSVKNFPPEESRYINSFACAFTVWGWNMQNPTELFVLLKELNDDYKKI
ncbi:MAG: hypothetical protein IJZ00_10900 [Lachnospiraceae bacterium]|nr:hypothetical protein [Lachnospiraceae bacterium]